MLRFNVQRGIWVAHIGRSLLCRQKQCRPNLQVFAQRTFLDARDKDHEKKEKRLIVQHGTVFDEAAKIARNKKTFKKAVQKFNDRKDIYKRGQVEFIYAAMDKIKDFNAEKDINTYKQLLNVFPKGKMIAETVWQVEFQYYPKQQQCGIDLLDYMEDKGVCPDDAMGQQLIEIFGQKSHVFRKYQRMMYWMPKFKHLNPYPVPYHVPTDPRILAALALKRMAVDVQNAITNFEAKDVEDCYDDTFIVSAQSPQQRRLLEELPRNKPVYVEGGYKVWLRHLFVIYFVLRSDITLAHTRYKEMKEKEDEFDFSWKMFEEDRDVVVKPSIHEQEDGTILAMCVTGTGSKESLVSWIKCLQKTNPALGEMPVVFTLRTPEAGLEIFKEKTEESAVV